jgi:pre-mRNA-splicing factor CWC22
VLWSETNVQGDKITFEMTLEDAIDKEEMLDVFRVDPDYEANENAWKEIKKVTDIIYVDHSETEELVQARR